MSDVPSFSDLVATACSEAADKRFRAARRAVSEVDFEVIDDDPTPTEIAALVPTARLLLEAARLEKAAAFYRDQTSSRLAPPGLEIFQGGVIGGGDVLSSTRHSARLRDEIKQALALEEDATDAD